LGKYRPYFTAAAIVNSPILAYRLVIILHVAILFV